MKVLAPFELCEDTINDPLVEVDPDVQYYRAIPNLVKNSDYFDQNSFREKVVEWNFDSNNLSIISINARSIPKNFHRIEQYLQSLPLSFSVVGVCETWHNESNCDYYNIDGYHKPEQLFRGLRSGGGVSIYVTNGLECTRRTDLDVFNDDI